MNEISETENLLKLATFPGLRQVLTGYLDSLQSSSSQSSTVKEESSVVDVQESPVIQESKTESVQPPPALVQNSSTDSSYAPQKIILSGGFVPITDFAWDQGGYNSPLVTIYIDLPSVGSVKQNCDIRFSRSSFDFSVTDLGGKNYRLLQDNLEKDIDPTLSKMTVKKDKVVIKLQKIKGDYSFETWTKLTAKKRRGEGDEKDKKKDPMGGIMDMMKDMYEDGDENMKKIIGEAMMKSQRGEKSSPPSMDDI